MKTSKNFKGEVVGAVLVLSKPIVDDMLKFITNSLGESHQAYAVLTDTYKNNVVQFTNSLLLHIFKALSLKYSQVIYDKVTISLKNDNLVSDKCINTLKAISVEFIDKLHKSLQDFISESVKGDAISAQINFDKFKTNIANATVVMLILEKLDPKK